MELLPPPRFQATDANGVPLANGKLYTYAAGTTTPQATYTDRTGLTANTNPVILDANGQADVWLDVLYYKLVLTDANGVTIWTKDQVALPSTAALASTPFRDVIYITSANSPLTIDATYNGKVISIDTTAGAVVINMPQISSLTLPLNVTFKLNAGSNTVTINRAGTDTINGATSKVLTVVGYVTQLVGETKQTPNDWVTLDFGNVVAASSISRTALATGAIAVPNRTTKSANYTATTSDDEIYVTASCTITLPAANTSGLRPITIIVNAAGITVTVVPTGADTILGDSSQNITGQYTRFKFMTDGTSNFTVEG